ncbi:MAG: VCBS repeat-containing protein [Bacteroidota bacterium]|nr:VCBS repeat-containing protein [Bacteroidota bacterium]
MKRFYVTTLALFIIATIGSSQTAKVTRSYSYPVDDTVLAGLKSIRGVAYDPNPEKNGKPEIAATNYYDLGHVNVFTPVGTDSLELVWTSPRVGKNGGGSTPRYVIFGDLDNDGKKEIIYQSQGNGIYIFEWDGVPGSHNYGTAPSQVITTPDLLDATGYVEYMEVTDVDGDGQNELLVAYNANGTSNDAYYIISAVGNWSTNDPGFSSFNVEYTGKRSDLVNYGLDGSPYAMISANLDGTGNKEILLHGWNHKDVTIMTVPSPNTYQLANTANGKQNIMLGGDDDDVALFGGMAYDIDKDGRDEIYLPTYPAVPAHHGGLVHMISYNQGQDLSQIDSTNVTTLDLSSVAGRQSIFGYGYGDIDGNGKPNLYFSTSLGANIISLEYEGGDKRDTSNWKASVLYAGDSTAYTAMTIRDSAGSIDTVSRKSNPAFVSKFYGHNTDIDGDHHEDIILPYQALNDSIAITKATWNSSSSHYDTTKYNVLNPNRSCLRVLTGSATTTGVRAKDLTLVTPNDYKLDQNYPNPFNPSTKISFTLPLNKQITLAVYDILGREVRTLINNEGYSKGIHSVVWDGKNDQGSAVASGTYIYRLKFGNFEKSKKMLLLK